ncbi:MAG: cytochrome P460 family protein, partial [Candidatus Poribacteria bacterium]|nr:cytochrome P460 family protein [Candidatus Poribacteria bacterium]
MLRFQIALAIILVGCMAFLSCGRTQPDLVEPVIEDMPTDMPMDMVAEMMKMYKSWDSVMLPAPMMTVEEAAAAMNPGGTGAIHGMGSRTVYFNEAGAMANRTGAAYPVGTVIVKEIMDDANMFVAKVAKMEKTADPMYASHGGWMYAKYARASEMAPYMMVGGGSLEASTGCHGCHAKASETIMKPTDSVFVSLPMKAVVTADHDRYGHTYVAPGVQV